MLHDRDRFTSENGLINLECCRVNSDEAYINWDLISNCRKRVLNDETDLTITITRGCPHANKYCTDGRTITMAAMKRWPTTDTRSNTCYGDFGAWLYYGGGLLTQIQTHAMETFGPGCIMEVAC